MPLDQLGVGEADAMPGAGDDESERDCDVVGVMVVAGAREGDAVSDAAGEKEVEKLCVTLSVVETLAIADLDDDDVCDIGNVAVLEGDALATPDLDNDDDKDLEVVAEFDADALAAPELDNDGDMDLDDEVELDADVLAAADLDNDDDSEVDADWATDTEAVLVAVAGATLTLTLTVTVLLPVGVTPVQGPYLI